MVCRESIRVNLQVRLFETPERHRCEGPHGIGEVPWRDACRTTVCVKLMRLSMFFWLLLATVVSLPVFYPEDLVETQVGLLLYPFAKEGYQKKVFL